MKKMIIYLGALFLANVGNAQLFATCCYKTWDLKQPCGVNLPACQKDTCSCNDSAEPDLDAGTTIFSITKLEDAKQITFTLKLKDKGGTATTTSENRTSLKRKGQEVCPDCGHEVYQHYFCDLLSK